MARFIFISDTHGLHSTMRYKIKRFIDPNQKNFLIHAGDCTNVGKEHEIIEFITWFKNLEGFDKKIFCAGNHDFGFERKGAWLDFHIDPDTLSEFNVVYLEDREYNIVSPEFSRPLKVYGSPWQPEFYNWAFNLPRNGEELEKKWNAIPEDVDLLLTHGPAHGILDYTPANVSVGCEILRFRVEQLKPLIHCWGHIHHARGIKELFGTFFINASICNERYQPINKPIVLDVVEVNGKFEVTIVD